MTLPDAAPVSGRSGADVVASLASPAVPAVAPMPLVVSEQAATTAPSQEWPDAATVVSEGVAQSVPPAAQVTAADAGRAESDAAAVVSEGAAQSVP